MGSTWTSCALIVGAAGELGVALVAASKDDEESPLAPGVVGEAVAVSSRETDCEHGFLESSSSEPESPGELSLESKPWTLGLGGWELEFFPDREREEERIPDIERSLKKHVHEYDSSLSQRTCEEGETIDNKARRTQRPRCNADIGSTTFVMQASLQN